MLLKNKLPRTCDPRLVILDLMMPEMDGFGFLAEFRREPRWARVPVVCVTAMDLSDADRKRLDGEVQRIIQKGGVDNRELLARVRELVDSCVVES